MATKKKPIKTIAQLAIINAPRSDSKSAELRKKVAPPLNKT
jgi:hypothetical protein